MLVRLVFALSVLVTLAACDLATTVKEGVEKSGLAATAIEKRVGLKPQVGFNFNNGSLTAVTVQFAGVPASPLTEIEKVVREEVHRTFQATPVNLVISFVFKGAA